MVQYQAMKCHQGNLMKLYLVRHGDYSTNMNRQQDILTEKGKKEIGKKGSELFEKAKGLLD